MIPNIVKGRGITGALAYVMSEGFAEDNGEGTANDNRQRGRYKTLAEGQESRATILGGQGFGFEIDSAERLDLARRVMEWQGFPDNQGSKTRKQDLDCLHASLSWHQGYTPDREEMVDAAEQFLKAIGLEKARAVFVAHDDTDHAHLHIVASRIDPETGKTLRVDYDQQAAQAWAVQWDRQHGVARESGLDKLADMVEARDYDALLQHFTKDRPTFLDSGIARAARFGRLDAEQAKEFRASLLAHPSLVALSDEPGGPVERYTTREILKQEMRVMRDAGELAADRSHGIDAARLDEVAARFTLKDEQADAMRHLTGDEGLAILWGEAGTGKTHTLKAARTAYEEEGARVIGLSWTNKVVADLRENGFGEADTVSRQLRALDHGRATWNADTVLMVDEAAMLSTKALAELTRRANEAGAKLILAGDDAQLASIEPGGLFARLRQEHGAATLSEVQRVKDAEIQAAFNAMHKRDFQSALQTFNDKGAIHWTEKHGGALAEMAGAYAEAVAADPDKTRFMFAYTNKDVATLNEQARALHRERGELGEDVTAPTAYGPQAWATGDRIQFTGNAWTQEARESGLVNGRVGTVESVGLDDAGRLRMTVALDGKEARSVSFVVGEDARAGEFDTFKRGYAGTIYKGQGATLDESFVLADEHWRASSAYVALSRHRESVSLYAAHESFDDLEDMARSFARLDGKDAALSYVVDEATLRELGAEIDAERRAAREMIHEPQEAATAGRADVGESPDATLAGAIEAGASQVAEFVADYAERAIETLAAGVESLFGGGSSGPTRQPPAAKPMTAKERHEARIAAFLEAENQQRAARLQESANSLGASQAMTPEELQREKEAQEKRSRDRGGGISL